MAALRPPCLLGNLYRVDSQQSLGGKGGCPKPLGLHSKLPWTLVWSDPCLSVASGPGPKPARRAQEKYRGPAPSKPEPASFLWMFPLRLSVNGPSWCPQPLPMPHPHPHRRLLTLRASQLFSSRCIHVRAFVLVATVLSVLSAKRRQQIFKYIKGVFVELQSVPRNLEGNGARLLRGRGPAPPSPANLLKARAVSPAPGGSSSPWFLGLEGCCLLILGMWGPAGPSWALASPAERRLCCLS